MKSVNEMPREGQFVAIWFVGDVLFSATLKRSHQQIRAYDFAEDYWLPECDHGFSEEFFTQHNAKYFKGE